MDSYGFSRKNQFFEQRMAEKLQPGLPPEWAQADKQLAPVPGNQGVPQWLRRQQQACILVKHRQRIAYRPAQRRNARGGDLGGLQTIEPRLGLRKAHPAQSIEEIMQALAGRALTTIENIAFVGLARWQIALWHKANRRRTLAVQRIVQRQAAGDFLRDAQSVLAPGSQPGLVPVNLFQRRNSSTVHPQFRDGLESLLSRTITVDFPSSMMSKSCVATSSLVSVA